MPFASAANDILLDLEGEREFADEDTRKKGKLCDVTQRRNFLSFAISLFGTLKYFFSCLGLLREFSKKAKCYFLPSKLVIVVCCPLLVPDGYDG